MVRVVISIGSNCGDRKSLVEEAIAWLKTILIQTQYSSVYETPCAKNIGRPYMNAVISGYYQAEGIDVKDSLEELLKEKEHEMGRTAQCRESGEVPIDMDVVLLNGDIVRPWDYRQKFFQKGYHEIS